MQRGSNAMHDWSGVWWQVEQDLSYDGVSR